MTRFVTRKTAALMAAAAMMIAHTCLAQALEPAPKLEYKGRTILGVPDGKDNQTFFDTVRKAIDMSETLPARQKQLAAQVKDLRYEPASPDSSRITDSIVGVYRAGKDPRVPGYISFRLSPARSSALDYLLSMVVNAGYDTWRTRLAEAFGEAAAAKKAGDAGGEAKAREKAAYYQKLFGKKDPDLNILAECAMGMDKLAVLKAVEAYPSRINAISRELANRNCHDRKPPY